MSSIKTMARRLRLAVVGLGFGRAVHLPAFSTMPEVEVVAVAGRRPEKAREAAAEYGVAQAVDLDALFSLELDAVSLALPPVANAVVAGRALERGWAVVSEKPIAGDAAAAARLTKLAQGRTTAVNFSFAELEPFLALKETLDSGRLGRVLSVHVGWLTHSYAHRSGQWGWKLDRAAGGGVLGAQASHLFYLFEWLLGGPLRLEHAALDDRMTAPLAPAGATAAEDGARLCLRGGAGVPILADLSNASPGCTHHRWEVVCEGGTLRLERDGPGVMDGFTLDLVEADGRHQRLSEDVMGTPAGGRLAPFLRLARRFVATAQGGTLCAPDFAAGLRVQTLIEMAVARHT